MAESGYSKSRFVFSETFNNQDGKTSGSGFIGVIFGFLVMISWLVGTAMIFFRIDYEMVDMYFKSNLGLVGSVTVLLGARKIVSAIGSSNGKKDAE